MYVLHMLQFNEFLVASFQYNLFSWSDKILFQQKKTQPLIKINWEFMKSCGEQLKDFCYT